MCRSPSTNTEVNTMSVDYDNATLRLCYARSMLTTLAIFMGEEKQIPHAPSLIADTLSGIELLIEDASHLIFRNN